eukprot:CAMPEP_0206547036 /NCGR_PEP_ID=MMETSP0325_2-20121206/13069_1 /ASSEMBLY_ACC=CAM_ASM_000347 /TAXON_ID=2866 /ORGANISM="Crypthecodinium cohnii, Strain Seligo" /LENGTH=234 /DNA_ID=CAMNT_0054046289 /DNA_START=170 /DNA_END=875 /DNA_ORIENTATION=-
MTTPSSEVWQSDSAKQSVHEFPKGDESIIAARRRRRRRGRRSKTDKELRQQKQKKKLGREEGRHQQKSQQRQQTLGRGREREGRHRFLHRQISPHSSAAGAQAHRKDVLPHSEKTRRRAVRGDFASGPNHPSAVSDSVAGLAVIPKNREDEAHVQDGGGVSPEALSLTPRHSLNKFRRARLGREDKEVVVHAGRRNGEVKVVPDSESVQIARLTLAPSSAVSRANVRHHDANLS